VHVSFHYWGYNAAQDLKTFTHVNRAGEKVVPEVVMKLEDSATMIIFTGKLAPQYFFSSMYKANAYEKDIYQVEVYLF
jgi:hypothetical protein